MHHPLESIPISPLDEFTRTKKIEYADIVPSDPKSISIGLLGDPKRSKKNEVAEISLSDPESILIGLLDDSTVSILGRIFPISTVWDWENITVGIELGGGQFGKVYKGFLHLNEYQR